MEHGRSRGIWTTILVIAFGLCLAFGLFFLEPGIRPAFMPMSAVARSLIVAVSVIASRLILVKNFVPIHIFSVWFCQLLAVLSVLHVRPMGTASMSFTLLGVTFLGMLFILFVLIFAEQAARCHQLTFFLCGGMFTASVVYAIIIALVDHSLFSQIAVAIRTPVFYVLAVCIAAAMTSFVVFIRHASAVSLLLCLSTTPFFYHLFTTNYFSVFTFLLFFSIYLTQVMGITLYLSIPDSMSDAVRPMIEKSVFPRQIFPLIAEEPHDVLELAANTSCIPGYISLAVSEFHPADIALMGLTGIDEKRITACSAQSMVQYLNQ